MTKESKEEAQGALLTPVRWDSVECCYFSDGGEEHSTTGTCGGFSRAIP